MDLQNKFDNLVWWAETMTEETEKQYKRWKAAETPEDKQEHWLRYNGRMREMMEALNRIWEDERITIEIKRRLWGRVHQLQMLINGKTQEGKEQACTGN